MKVAFDTETEMIGGCFGLAPPLIACGFCFIQEEENELKTFLPRFREVFGNDIKNDCTFFVNVNYNQGFARFVMDRIDTIKLFKFLCQSTDFHFIAHNVAFDLAVLSASDPRVLKDIFSILDQKRVHCTYLREMMLTIKNGGSLLTSDFSLKGLVARLRGVPIEKNQDIRTSFTNVKHLPINEWPKEYLSYLLDDITYLYPIFLAQDSVKMHYISYLEKQFDSLVAEPNRVSAAFALYMASCRGLRVDVAQALRMKETLEPELHEIEHRMVQAGFAQYKSSYLDKVNGVVRVKKTKKNSSQSTQDVEEIVDEKSSIVSQNKKAIQEYLVSNGLAQQTSKGNVRVDAEVLMNCGHQVLEDMAKFGGKKTVLTTYIPALLDADKTPSKVLHPRFYPYSETGRVNGREPNLLNLPRAGGVRECFIAREGYCFIFCDYDAAEMRTFGQALLDIVGKSKLAEMYQADPNFDPHSYLASEFLQISYKDGIAKKKMGDKEFKNIRQLMKAANFGFLGGASAKTFLLYAKGYGINDLTVEKAQSLRNFYLRVFPEVKQYFQWISSRIASNQRDDDMDAILMRSGRIAGHRRYTQACNLYVQGVAADGALQAFYNITKDCFNKDSSLYSCRPVLFIHDEIIVEAPIEKASIASKEIQRHMEECMRIYTPDVPSSCSPSMSLRWYKEADAVYDENGNLGIWSPKK